MESSEHEQPVEEASFLSGGNSVPASAEQLLGLAEEQLLGQSERGQMANAALRALARASRAYLIYDANNAAILAFLSDVRASFAGYCERFGDLVLAVRPFELVLDRETVYVERDRERSLAFKLFRDGVRKLTIAREVTWEELTRLLETLSIRYTGIRLHEDDVVTLLWKAGFTHITLEAVEGFVPEEEETEEGEGGELEGALGWVRAEQVRVPADFDLPLPGLAEQDDSKLAFRTVPRELREQLCEEETSAHLPGLTLNLMEALIATALSPTDPLDFPQILPLLRDTRDFLMAEDQLDALLRLFARLGDARRQLGELGEILDPVLGSFFGLRGLRKIVQTVPHDALEPPPAFYRMLDTMPGDGLPLLLDLLAELRQPHQRRVLRQLIESYLPQRAQFLLTRYETVGGEVAADLLRILVTRAPEHARAPLNRLAQSGDSEVQLEFLRLLEAERVPGSTRALLIQLLHAPDPEVRIKTLGIIRELGESGAFRAIVKVLETNAAEYQDDELAAYGRTLAGVNPALALERCTQWVEPKGLFPWFRTTRGPLCQVALAALSELDAPEVDGLLRSVARGGFTEKLRDAAREALRQRRRGSALSDAVPAPRLAGRGGESSSSWAARSQRSGPVVSRPPGEGSLGSDLSEPSVGSESLSSAGGLSSSSLGAGSPGSGSLGSGSLGSGSLDSSLGSGSLGTRSSGSLGTRSGSIGARSGEAIRRAGPIVPRAATSGGSIPAVPETPKRKPAEEDWPYPFPSPWVDP